LAHAYGMTGFQRAIAPDENMAKFRTLTQKALELDGGLAEAHVDLGDIKFYGDWDWSSGEGEFQRAVQLDRGSVDAQEHYAMCLWILRRYNAAVQEMRRALRLDPLSPRLTLELGSLMRAQGNTEESIRNYKRALELEPGYGAAVLALANVYEELGRDQEAIAAYLRAASLDGEDPKTVELLSEAFESEGFPGYWKLRLRQLQIRSKRETVSPLAFASIYVRLGQHENAINWLERAYRQHVPSLVWINANRAWDPLRGDRRFNNLLLRMGFPRDRACREETDVGRINDAAETS
jgi:tetratricopeptide (TPR) repeat protein